MSEKTYYLQSGHSIPINKDGQVRFINPNGNPISSNLISVMGNKRLEQLIKNGVLGEKIPAIDNEVDKSISTNGTVQVPRSQKDSITESTFADVSSKKDKKEDK